MRCLGLAITMSAITTLSLIGQQTRVSIDPPAGARVVLSARGEGVQVYSCSTAQGGYKWVLTAPDARLLDDAGRQIGTHFAGPTWKLTDGSHVVGELMASRPSPDTDSVAWLLLQAKPGSASGKLADVGFVRRTDTHGGVAAKAGCQGAADAGKTARVPYTATYTFYAALK